MCSNLYHIHVFQDAFNDGVEEETRRKSHIPCHDEEEDGETSFVKRRRVDSLPMDSALAWHAQVDTVANVVEDNEDLPLKNVSRGNLLLGIFQKSISREASDFAKEVENHPSGMTHGLRPKVLRYEEARGKSHETIVEERLAKEVKLIRIFPGPAGLVPDQVKNDTTISAASYLSSVEDVEKNKTATKPRSSREIKSQDEKNLVGEKAWKLLLNDLPKDFLQDYNISAVKDKANASRCDSTKVRFIAGVLDYVDPSHDDPFVVLKDSSGSIEGTIHRDIPLTYPGILEPNVVILLRDVGLIKTTTYVVTNKYHILVSLVNLLAIYSDRGRIVSTSFMESILSHSSNGINNHRPASLSGLQKMDESRMASRQASSSIDSTSLRIETRQAESATTSLLHPTNEKYESCGEALGRGKNCQETLGCVNYSMDTDDLDNMDNFFTTDCDFASLKEQDGLDHSQRKSTSISRANKIQRCNLQVENMENMKKESTVNFQEQTKERHLPQILQKCVTNVNTRDTRYSRENCFSPYDTVACRDSNVNAMSTLPKIKRNIENSKTLISYFNDNEGDKYDSDDEILSQLDVDKVFDESKKNC